MKSQAEKAGVVGKKLTFFCRALELITKSDGREEGGTVVSCRAVGVKGGKVGLIQS